MREYYRNARTIFRAALHEMEAVEGQGSSLLAGFRDWRSRLSNAEFTVSRERVLFKAPQRLEKDPELALRLFQLVGRHRLGLHRESERRIQEYLPAMKAAFAANPNLWPPVHDLLALPHASAALRAMHETGLLKAVFPEWETIECYVVRDFHHRYTVDEHSLVTIENLEDLQALKEGPKLRFAHLLSEIADVAVLKLALLLHDTGKGTSEAGHAAESAQLANAASLRLGAPEHARQALAFLIEHHLDLSSAMNGRDLDDPDTAVWLAGRIQTLENLKNLTLLTYCDIGAVNPTALSPWRLCRPGAWSSSGAFTWSRTASSRANSRRIASPRPPPARPSEPPSSKASPFATCASIPTPRLTATSPWKSAAPRPASPSRSTSRAAFIN
jgi:[protein-PII] uridylyltransferase